MHPWPVAWHADWIWNEPPPRASLGRARGRPDDDQMVQLRRLLDLGSVPQSVPVRVIADGRFVLRVNGTEVLRGPARSAHGVLFYDEIDLAGYLRGGRNEVSALVRHYAQAVPWWLPSQAVGELGRGGFVLESATFAGLSTGEGWKARAGGWSFGPSMTFGPPNERVDSALAASVPWAPAVVLAGGRPPSMPFTVVEASPLPRPTDDIVQLTAVARGTCEGDLPPPGWRGHPVDALYAPGGRLADLHAAEALPADLAAGDGLILDAGMMTIGIIEIGVDADAGTTVELRASERRQDGQPVDPDRQWLYRHTCAGGPERVSPFEVVGLRWLQLSVDGPARVTSALVRERRYPLDLTGSFSSDDADLDAVWAIGRRTLELCSTDAFLDCPGREQRAWLGDAYVHGLLTLVTSADTRLAAHALRLAAGSGRTDGLLAMVAAGDMAVSPVTIPDYSLHWIRAVARAWEYTGDRALLEEVLHAAVPILDWYWRYVEDGVLGPVPGWVFIDWYPVVGDIAIASMHGLLVLALDDHAAIAEATEQPAVARRSRERTETLRAGFKYFVRDRVLEEPERGTATQHALALAILAGVVEDGPVLLEHAVAPSVARYPVRRIRSPRGWDWPDGFDPARHVLATQPFFAHWLHQAMAQVGRVDLVLDSIRRWKQFVDAGDGSVWEHWVDQGEAHSHAHAWSATPTYDLPTHVLGVRPASPGFATVTVRPWLGPLARGAGTVPTPLGPVRVDLRRDGASVLGTVELPAGATGVLELNGSSRPLAAGTNEVS